MPLPAIVHSIPTDLTAYTPSCGASARCRYIRVPFRCRLLRRPVFSRCHHDRRRAPSQLLRMPLARDVHRDASRLCRRPVVFVTPPSPTYLNEDDVIVLTPSGASVRRCRCKYSIAWPADYVVGVAAGLTYDSQAGRERSRNRRLAIRRWRSRRCLAGADRGIGS